jgi:hypothetical protein
MACWYVHSITLTEGGCVAEPDAAGKVLWGSVCATCFPSHSVTCAATCLHCLRCVPYSGGVCAKQLGGLCGFGKQCQVPTDCDSKLCDPQTRKCICSQGLVPQGPFCIQPPALPAVPPREPTPAVPPVGGVATPGSTPGSATSATGPGAAVGLTRLPSSSPSIWTPGPVAVGGVTPLVPGAPGVAPVAPGVAPVPGTPGTPPAVPRVSAY